MLLSSSVFLRFRDSVYCYQALKPPQHPTKMFASAFNTVAVSAPEPDLFSGMGLDFRDQLENFQTMWATAYTSLSMDLRCDSPVAQFGDFGFSRSPPELKNLGTIEANVSAPRTRPSTPISAAPLDPTKTSATPPQVHSPRSGGEMPEDEEEECDGSVDTVTALQMANAAAFKAQAPSPGTPLSYIAFYYIPPMEVVEDKPAPTSVKGKKKAAKLAKQAAAAAAAAIHTYITIDGKTYMLPAAAEEIVSYQAVCTVMGAAAESS